MQVLEEIKNEIGRYIKDVKFEVANIILYTDNKVFFLNSRPKILELVNKLKKRIEVRMDPDFLMSEGEAEKKIREIIPKEARIQNIFFDSRRSVVVIEVEKPNVVTTQMLEEIRRRTLWTPIIRRAPIEKTPVIQAVKQILYQNSEYRRKLMHEIGEKIYYSTWRKDRRYFIRTIMLGGTREVGRSSILIQTPNSKILLDCGIGFNPVDPFPRFDMANISLNEIDAIIVTHAHLDHIALVPYLFKMGYDGPVYMTEPTRDIGTLICMDFVDVMKSEGGEPLYSSKDIREMLKHTITIPYEVVTDITPDIRLTFHNAGHILGSSMVHLNIGNGTHNVLYTGDFKFGETFLLDPAVNEFKRLETLIIESTYGSSSDVGQSRKEAQKELIETIKRTIERGGKVLVPVFGVGRAQEITLAIIDAISRKELPVDLPVYLDGMIWDITALHISYPEYMKKDLYRRIMEGDNPFKYENVIRVGKKAERMQLIEEKGPGVILATSGMLVGGPSIEYLKGLGWDARNTLVFVTYQAEGTLGRKILDGLREIQFFEEGKMVAMKLELEIKKIEGFSGHSNRKEIENYLEKLEPKPRRVIVVHGEREKSVDLAKYINKKYKIETNVPRVGDALRIR